MHRVVLWTWCAIALIAVLVTSSANGAASINEQGTNSPSSSSEASTASSASSASSPTSPPKGHLERFGAHREAWKVDEVHTGFPPVMRLLTDHIIHESPLVLRGAINTWPIRQLWGTDGEQYLRDRAGDVIERVHKLDANSHPSQSAEQVTINQFLSSTATTTDAPSPPTVLFGRVPDAIKSDMWWPADYLYLMERTREPSMWLTSPLNNNNNNNNAQQRLNLTQLRYDSYDTFSCVLEGSVEWTMVDRSLKKLMYMEVVSDEDEDVMTSQFDSHAVDLQEFPLAQHVPWYHATVNAGDCVYVPGEWIHQAHLPSSSSSQQSKRTFAVNVVFISTDEHKKTLSQRAANASSSSSSETRLWSDREYWTWLHHPSELPLINEERARQNQTAVHDTMVDQEEEEENEDEDDEEGEEGENEHPNGDGGEGSGGDDEEPADDEEPEDDEVAAAVKASSPAAKVTGRGAASVDDLEQQGPKDDL